MENTQQCECDICKKHRKLYGTDTKKSTFYDIQEGDSIKIFSCGMYIGTGVFVSVDHRFLTWIDSKGNLNITAIPSMTIRKL